MSFRKITLANAAVAATIIAGGTLFAVAANAAPGKGGGFGSGGFKPSSISKPIGPVKSFPSGPIKAGPFKPFPPKGPIVTGPIKPFPGPIKPSPTGPVKPGHAHGHGKYWAWAGVTILASQYDGCGYEYYKWKSTGSSYWHAQYAECRGW